MRKILTVNNQVEFHEISSDGVILNIKAFQYGVLHYQIKNGKVVFYSNADENPWRNEVWTVDMPVTIDDEVYSTADEVAEALSAVMNDSYQEQLDELQEGLATEEGRAQAAEEALQTAIENETSRATSAETNLQSEITSVSATVATFDGRITNVENGLSALTETVNDEITRSTAKDSEHDALISGLNTSLQTEINRAQGAENSLRSDLNAEIARATNAEDALDGKIDTEIRDRINAISGLNNSLNAEIARATNAETALNEKVNALSAYNASQDAQIEAVTNSINTEISRATSAENSLRSDLNAEISARTNADAAQLQRITALEVGKADANSVYTKTESDAKYTTKDYISGLTEAFFDAAAYDSQTKKINFYHGNTIKAQIDATSFIKDGMVDNVAISGSNLVITFNTDAGKEPISIPLTDIFNPANYYTKSEIDSALSGKVDNSTFNTLSGRVDTISGDVITVSGRVDTISGTVETVKQEIITISGESVTSGEVQTMINESISGKADSDDVYTKNEVYTKAEVDEAIADIDLSDFYTKSEVDASQLAQDNKINAISGSAITSGEVQTQIDNSISRKQDTLSAGRAIDITNNVVSFTLPISAGTGENSVVENHTTNKATKNNSHAEGYQTEANGSASHAEGTNSKTSGNSAHAEGYETKAIGEHSHSEGRFTTANGTASHAEGFSTQTSGNYEHASGYCNRTYHYPNTSFGNSANTLFTVGNSEVKSLHTDYEKHNAFEVRENGDIYIADTSQITGSGSGETEGHNFYDVPMIKLQDALGQGGGVTPSEVQTMIDESISGKTNQSDFTAHTADSTVHVTASEKNTWNAKSDFSGDYNDLTNKPTIPNYTAGSGITISNNVISAKIWSGTKAQYDAITTKDADTIYLIYNS